MKTWTIMICAAALLSTAAGCKKDKEKTSSETAAPASPMASAPAIAPPADSAAASSVVVTVNGESLSRAETDRRVRMLAMRQGVPEQAMDQALQMMGPQIEQQVVEQFVDVTLLQAEADKRGIVASDDDVEAFMSNLVTRLPPGTTLDQMFAAQGVTRKDVEDDVRKSEQLRKLLDAETDELEPIKETEIKGFYTNNLQRFSQPAQVSARHILLKTEPDASKEEKQAARTKMAGILKELEDGGDFAALAAKYSDCPSKEKGGDLGTFGRGQMVKPFEDAAYAQEIGKVGPIVETRFGYHVIEVTDRTDGATASYEEVHDQIEQNLVNSQKNAKIESLIDTLKKDAEITYPES